MTSAEYQKQVAKMLGLIFGEEMVKTEWDASTYDPHTFWHRSAYAPRLDIAVGPFNGMMDIDVGFDRTNSMQSHQFVKKLREKIDIKWNKFSRSFLAIEIEFSGSSKHIMGDIVNACMSGSVGVLISSKKNYEKVRRVSSYLSILDMNRIDIKRNFVLFQEQDFIKFLSGLKQK